MATDKERELERTTAARGFRYGLHDFLAEMDVELLKRHNDEVEANYLNESLLDRKTKELLMVVAYMAEKEVIPKIQMHIHAAHRAGATGEEVMEAIDLIGGVLGAVGKAKGIEAWRAVFRPDLPTVERIVELR